MRFTWIGLSLLAASIVSVGCGGSKGKTSGPTGTGGQITIAPLTSGSESAGSIDASGGGNTAVTTTGGATVTSSPGTGGMGGIATTASSYTAGNRSIGGVPAGTPVAAADFVGAFTAAVCDSVEPCCQASKYGWSRSGCESAAAKLVQTSAASASIAGVTWDAQAAGKCIAGIKHDYAGCNAPINIDLYDACRAVLVGSKAPGEACTNQLECASPPNGQARCTSLRTDAGTVTPQVCTVQASMYARGKLGDPCNENCKYSDIGSLSCYGGPGTKNGSANAPIVANCFENDGLYCDDVTVTCTARKPLGAACKQHFECEVGRFCQSGKCATPLPLGASCVSGGCEPGLYCEMRKEFVCKQALPDGSSCSASPDSHCGSGLCLCDPKNQSNCVCGSWPRWGQVNEVQCTGSMTFPTVDAGVPGKG
jgi:hypothetical protein